MLERLQKIISAAGVASRRAAEELITEGRVRVNGKVVTELGSKADAAKDHIKVDGKLINPHQPLTYIMLNKPAGYVTTMSDPEGRPTVQDLLKGVKTRVYPVGRLDYSTEGLLLLTNDGDFANLITHPRHEFPKTYLAKVKGVLDERQIGMLEQGMFLQDGKTASAKVKKIRKEEANSWVEITIHEGRKRQVRRMFDHIGSSVIKLKRIRTGDLSLGDLPDGRFRYLTADEVKALRETALKTDDTGNHVRVYKPAVKAARPEEAVRRRPAGDRRTVRSDANVMHDTRQGRRRSRAAVVTPGTGERGRHAATKTFARKREGNYTGATEPATRRTSGTNTKKSDSRRRGPGFGSREIGPGGQRRPRPGAGGRRTQAGKRGPRR